MPVFGEDESKRKVAPVINEIVGRVNDNTKRLRLLEERERLLASRISSLEESVFQKIKDINEYTKELNGKIAAQDEKTETLQTTLKEVIGQMRLFATKTDVKKLEETIKIFDPLKSQFMSREEMKDIREK